MKKLDTKTLRSHLAAVTVPALLTMPVLADNISDSQVGQGVKNLFSDLSTWLVILSPIVAGSMAVYFVIRRSMADEQDGKLWEKRIKTSIVCGVAGALIGGIIKLIASYF